MKKLLAILAALLLPVCAVAEPYGVTIRVEAPDDAFVDFIQSAIALGGMTDSDVESEAALLQKLIDGLTLRIDEDGDAAAFELSLGAQRLIDYACYASGDKVLMTSDMFPGYAIETALPSENLLQIDWTGAMLSAAPELAKWLETHQPQQSHGVFVGDAFDGGAQCLTWEITDVDIAALVNAILTEDIHAGFYAIAAAVGLDGDALMAEFTALNDKIAKENLHTYLLRLVMDNQGTLVGASVTVHQGTQQLATLSIGVDEKGLLAIVGLGFEKMNYWGEFTLTGSVEGDILYLSGANREWNALKDEMYSYVSHAHEPTFQSNWTLEASKDENGAVNAVLAVGGEKAAFNIVIESGTANDVLPMASDVIICSDTDPEDEALYAELIERSAASLLARVIKVLPMDLVMQMNQITLP